MGSMDKIKIEHLPEKDLKTEIRKFIDGIGMAEFAINEIAFIRRKDEGEKLDKLVEEYKAANTKIINQLKEFGLMPK